MLEIHGLTGSWGWTFATDEHVWSPGLYRLLGLDPGAIRPSYANLLALVHPDDRLDLATTAQAIQSGTLPDCTVRVIRPDGSLRILSLRGEIYHDPDGRPRAAAGTVLDVTDRERLAAVQAEERRRRRALFEQTQSWIHAAVDDPALRVGSQEVLALTGLTQDEYRDDCCRVIAPDDRPRAREQVRTLLEAGRPFVMGKALRLAEGGEARFRFAYAPLRDEGDERDAIRSWAIMVARFDGPMAASLDEPVRQGLESGIDGRHLRAARGLLDWSMQDLAAQSGLSLSSIRRLEDNGEALTSRTRRAAIAALREAGIVFMLTDGNAMAVYRK
ncbi:PAS domain-containing protein [Methylobacterium sp. Gmos1]